MREDIVLIVLIDGIDKLRSNIPAELQFWCVFSNIIELHYYMDIDEFGQDGKCLKLILADEERRLSVSSPLLKRTNN